MRAVIQRVLQASVMIDNNPGSYREKCEIKNGLLVFVGIEDIEWLSHKVVTLRIFDDENNVPNISVKDIDGDILAVSQFTLHALTKKGNRPSYIKASKAEIAIPLYKKLSLIH